MENSNENVSLQSLSKAIVFGEELLEKIVKEENLETEHLVVITLFRKLLEQLDGNFVLADHRLESASKVMIRASLETYLALSYILQEKRRIKDRAFSYYIGYVKCQHETAKYGLENSIEGIPHDKLEAILQKCNEILAKPKFRKVLAEWERTKIALKKDYEPKWHSLFRGPRSIKQLIGRLQESNSYKFYELLSTEAHGYQALNGLHSEDNSMLMKPIRSGDGDFQAELARALCISAAMKIIYNLFPQHEDMLIAICKDIGIIPGTFPFTYKP